MSLVGQKNVKNESVPNETNYFLSGKTVGTFVVKLTYNNFCWFLVFGRWEASNILILSKKSSRRSSTVCAQDPRPKFQHFTLKKYTRFPSTSIKVIHNPSTIIFSISPKNTPLYLTLYWTKSTIRLTFSIN
jgi:hypothetical protein